MPGVDGSIRLDEVIVRPGPDGPALGADNSRRNRVVQSERITYGHDPLPHLQGVGIAELQIRQTLVGLYLQKSQIRFLVRAHHFGVVGLLAVSVAEQIDFDGVRAVNDVIVGHNIAVGGNDEPRPQRALLPRHAAPLLTEETLELIEKILEGVLTVRAPKKRSHVSLLPFDQLDRADVDYGLPGCFGQLREIRKLGGQGGRSREHEKNCQKTKGMFHIYLQRCGWP